MIKKYKLLSSGLKFKWIYGSNSSVFVVKKKKKKISEKPKLKQSFHMVFPFGRTSTWVCVLLSVWCWRLQGAEPTAATSRSASKPAASSPDWPSHTFKALMCPADNVSVSLDLRSIRTRAGCSAFWLARRLSNVFTSPEINSGNWRWRWGTLPWTCGEIRRVVLFFDFSTV